MGRSRSSSDPELILVPKRPRRTGWFWLVMLLIVALVSAAGLAAGYYLGIKDEIEVIQERRELKLVKKQLEQQLLEVQGKAAIHKHGSELERQASERVRQENIQLQNRVSELEEAVTFYKSIMAPKKNDKGLRIERLELLPTFNKSRFKYKVVMTQVADNRSYISGKVKINLLGVKEGQKQSISFDEISKDMEAAGAQFKFRYFQDVKGEIVVPGGFIPEQIEVIAQSKGRKATRLEKRFDWKVQEVANDVGKG